MKKALQGLLIFFLVCTLTKSGAQDRVNLLSSGSAIPSARFSGQHFDAAQNIPNPFSTYTDIAFYMPVQGYVEFKLVNLIGKEIVRQVVEAESGANALRFDASDVIPGVYVFSLSNGSQTLTRRMIISKK